MKFSISRETLLRPLSMMSGVVGRRHTLPILSHIRIDATEEGLILTGLDLEVELIWRVPLNHLDTSGSITVPAKKLSDICRSLADEAVIEFALEDQRAVVRSGRSRFVLATLPSSEFPSVQLSPERYRITLHESELLNLIRRNSFAMAKQDVRYYLNGMLFELQTGCLRAVATDGHRLSLDEIKLNSASEYEKSSMIVPAKAVNEVAKVLVDPGVEVEMELQWIQPPSQALLNTSSQDSKTLEVRPRVGGGYEIIKNPSVYTQAVESGKSHIPVRISDFHVDLIFGEQHFQVNGQNMTFISKQIEGRYPDYERVIPRGGNKHIICDRVELRQMLSRIGILANEKFLGIRLLLSNNTLTLVANNPEQEEAEESMNIAYQGEPLEMGFNVSYLIDVMDNIGDHVKDVQISLSDPGSSALIRAAESGSAVYVVMPMRL